MDGAQFAKLCKECCLVDGRLTLAGVDLSYGKVADKVRGHASAGMAWLVWTDAARLSDR